MNTAELGHLLRNYQRDAMRTALVTEPSKDLLIRTCGLVGEFGEFFDEPSAEELGDLIWYIAAVCDTAGLNIADLVEGNPLLIKILDQYADPEFIASMGPRALLSVCRVAEYVKKTAGHGRDLPRTKLTDPLRVVLAFSVACAADFDTSEGEGLPALLAANVAKLRARHANAGPAGFDPTYGQPRPVAEIPEWLQREARAVEAHSYDANGSPVEPHSYNDVAVKTCDTCPAESCEYRGDDYNTEGDCLAEK